MNQSSLNTEVTKFLDSLNHPLRDEIDYIRTIIMSTELGLIEGIKWNGPNCSIQNEDRITIKIQPPKQIQVIFHRGAKVKVKPNDRLLKDTYNILEWKEKDRAVATFKKLSEIRTCSPILKEIVIEWVRVTSSIWGLGNVVI